MPSWYIAGNERFRGPAVAGSGSAFTGAGDVVSGALAYWDAVFAYSAASIGGNVVKLRESGGNTTQIFTSQADGKVNLSAISSFKGGNSLFVDTLYDQTGNGFDLTQSTQANQPPYLLSQVGSLPAIVTDGATFYILRKLSIASGQAVPVTLAGMANAQGTSGIWEFIWSDETAGTFNLGVTVNLNTLEYDITDGVPISSTASSVGNAAYVTIFGGSTSNASWFNVNGTENSGTMSGSVNITTGDNFNLLAYSNGARLYQGLFGGIGLWPVGQATFDNAHRNSMVSNIRTRWGF